jgi:hypothetical protein
MSELGAASWRQRRQILRARPQPEEPKRSNHKDTKKWCKGVKGREHDYKWGLSNKFPANWDWYDLACTKCGKHKSYCTKTFFGIKDKCKCGFHKVK